MPVQRRVTGAAARGMHRDSNGELARPPRQRQCASEASPVTARELDLAGNGLIQVPISHLRDRAYPRGLLLIIKVPRQLVATGGNGFGVILPFPGFSDSPPVASGCAR